MNATHAALIQTTEANGIALLALTDGWDTAQLVEFIPADDAEDTVDAEQVVLAQGLTVADDWELTQFEGHEVLAAEVA